MARKVPVGTIVAVGGIGALILGGVAYATGKIPGTAVKKKADDAAAKAAAADKAFATLLAPATAASTAAMGPESAPFTLGGAGAVGLAWSKLSTQDKANLLDGGVAAGTDAAVAAAAKQSVVTPPAPGFVGGTAAAADSTAMAGYNPLPSRYTNQGFLKKTQALSSANLGAIVAGGISVPNEFVAIFNWIIDAFKKLAAAFAKFFASTVKTLGKNVCAATEKPAALLRQNNALPSAWNSWSCDQKIAFIATVGPWGLGMLAGVAGGVALTNGAVKALAPAFAAAEKNVSNVGKLFDVSGNLRALEKQLGLAAGIFAAVGDPSQIAKQVSDAASHAGQQVTNIGKKIFGDFEGLALAPGSMGACSCTLLSRGPSKTPSSNQAMSMGAAMSTQQPLPSDNLPNSSFITPAGVVPTIAVANLWQSSGSAPQTPSGPSQAPVPRAPSPFPAYRLDRYGRMVSTAIPGVK